MQRFPNVRDPLYFFNSLLGQGNRDLDLRAPVGMVPQMDPTCLKLHSPPGM